MASNSALRTYRLGLVGLGGMAYEHIKWLTAAGRFAVIAVSDVNTDALTRGGERLGVAAAKRYADYAALADDPDVDAVVSVTPNHIHADVIRACLQAGKPFMSEKPFTREFAEAEALKALYDRRPVPAMIGFSYRYTPAFRYARELVRSGKLGAVRSFSGRYLQSWGSPLYNTPYSWRFDAALSGTGVLADLGSHMIDMARFVIGEFSEVTAQLHNIVSARPDPATGLPVRTDIDDFAGFQARMADGAAGVFQTSRNAVGSGNEHELSVYGDTGTLHASTLNPDRLVWIREESPGQLARAELEVPQRCKVSQYADFLAMLDGAAPDGLPGFLDGYRNQQVLDAVIRANEARAAVRLPQ